MENVGLTTPESNPKPQQMDLPLEVAEKKEEGIKWEGSVVDEDDNADVSNTRRDISLRFENNEFFVDEGKVSTSKFLDILGKGAQILYRQRPDIEKVFKEIVYYEELEKRVNGKIIDKKENEKMQQSLREDNLK